MNQKKKTKGPSGLKIYPLNQQAKIEKSITLDMSGMPRDFQSKYGPNRNKPRGNKAKAPTMKESELQEMCEQYLDAHSLLYFRLPDALMKMLFGYGRVKMPLWVRGVAKRFLAGWPDLIVFKDGRYVAIELKSEIGKLSHEQGRKLRLLGGHVVRSFEEFRAIVDEWVK